MPNRLNWTLFDFIVMGGLVFVMGSLYVLAIKRADKYKFAISLTFALVFLWLWAELAVGVFTNWGS